MRSPGCELPPPPHTTNMRHLFPAPEADCGRNIWSPTQNRDIVQAIAKNYKFSARLGVTILGWDEARWQVIEKLRHPKGSNPGVLRTGDHGRLRARRTLNPRNAVLETVIPSSVAERRAAAARAGQKVPELHDEDLHMYKLLQEQYNYTTIDHGSSCRLFFFFGPRLWQIEAS